MLSDDQAKVKKLSEEVEVFTECFMREARRIVIDNIRVQKVGLTPLLNSMSTPIGAK